MRIKTFLRGRKGTSTVIFAMALVLIMGCTSISIDIGLLIHEKSKISAAADAAALAGAQELVLDMDEAIPVTRSYLLKNGIQPDDADVELSEDRKTVRVVSRKSVNYFFAPVLGFHDGEVEVEAAAKTAPVTRVYQGLRPFAVEDMELHFGQQVVLKEGGGSGSNGNYGALALGGRGAANYRNNIIYGYDSALKIGDWIDTETGNMSGPTETGVNTLIRSCGHSPKCTFDRFQPDCPRVVTVIIVDSMDVNGRKPVKVVGFASFFLEGVGGNGHECNVTGRFIRTVTAGETSDSQTDYGLVGIRLVK